MSSTTTTTTSPTEQTGAEQTDGRNNGQTGAQTTAAELAALTAAATEAARILARSSTETRAGWLEAIADSLDAHRDELVTIADAETHLGVPRLTG